MYLSLAARILLTTGWFCCHALHCGLEWAHHAPIVAGLVAGMSPVLLTKVVFVVALVSATVLTAMDIAGARSLFSFSCATIHALNAAHGWSILDPNIGFYLRSALPLLTETASVIGILCAASLAATLEYVYAVKNLLQKAFRRRRS
jgi:hypothetical protein